MSFSTPFITRPVATTLLTAGVALAGVAAFLLLPVSPLPEVDFPTISVQAQMPGASPETMATSVATLSYRGFEHLPKRQHRWRSRRLDEAIISARLSGGLDTSCAKQRPVRQAPHRPVKSNDAMLSGNSMARTSRRMRYGSRPIW